MLGRLLRCAILLHACWWFGWFAPAHQRGSVVLPGDTRGQATECATQAARQPAGGCCASDRSSPDSDEDPSSRDPSRRCFVCYLVAKLDTPPAADLGLGPAQPLAILRATGHAQPARCAPLSTYLGRAPPAIHLI